jgi:hypothetical protein
MKLLPRILLVLLLGIAFAGAQNSFYSQYGFGIKSPSISVRSLGMGKTGAASRDTLSLNTLNPALWTNFSTTSLQGQMFSSVLVTSKLSFSNWLNRFTGFSAKFPVGKRIGIALGIQPQTRMNVQQSVMDSVLYLDEYVRYSTQVEGLGGVSSFFIGTGYRLTPHFNLGLRARFFFGKFSHEIATDIDDDGNLDDYYSKDLKIDGIQLGAGFLWMSPNRSLQLAAYSDQSLYFKYRISYDYTYGPDTTLGSVDLQYPSSYGLGVRQQLNSGFALNFDARFTQVAENLYQEFYIFQPIASRDAYYFGLGLEKEPRSNKRRGFSQKLSYRAGLYYETASFYRQDPFKEIGITLGLSMPFNQDQSRLDFAIVLAQRSGFLKADIGVENLVNFHIGITTGEQWFKKFRKR